MRSSRLTGLILVAAAATTAGCGGDDGPSSTGTSTATNTQETTSTGATTTATTASKEGTDDPAPGRTVQAFYNKMSQRDGDGACTYLNEDQRQVAIRVVRKRFTAARDVKTCGDALQASVAPVSDAQLRILRDVKILRSTVAGGLATVGVRRAPSDILLTRHGGRWLISAGIFRT